MAATVYAVNTKQMYKANFTEGQNNDLKNIIRKHRNAFVGPDGALRKYTGPVRHRIDLVENAKIPSAKIYQVPPEKKIEIEKPINQMLKDNIIRESNSPFCAPIVLLKKADKKS
uniref:Reverse transcriptase domain-containing protein n=1 Tax=Heterorhabditis bacteriophora TaxID=37862 RepID=A0A1I7XR55_HETBA